MSDLGVATGEGRAVTTPVEVANGVQPDGSRLPTWNPVLFQPRTGPLLLFYKVGPAPASCGIDEDVTRMAVARGPIHAACRSAFSAPSRTSPCSSPRRHPSARRARRTEAGRVRFEHTADLGRTWRTVGPVNDPRQIGAIQPSILRHKDGRLQAIGRTQQDRLFTSKSTDGGNTWSEMQLLDLPNRMRDRRGHARRRPVTCSSTTTPWARGQLAAGRSVLNVAVSGMADVDAALVLESEPGQEFSYPGGHPGVGRSRPHHLHVEAHAYPARGRQSGEARSAAHRRRRMAAIAREIDAGSGERMLPGPPVRIT